MRGALAVLLGALVVAGCSVVVRGSPGALVLPPGRVLVIARSGPEGRVVADAAARRLLEALRDSFDVVGQVEALRGAPSLHPVLRQLQAGVWPRAEEAAQLAAVGLVGVLTVEVTAYDQVWTADGKATWAGLIAEAFMVPAGPGGWRVYREARVDDRRGHAFQSALDEAVSSLAAAIVPSNAVPVVGVRPRAEGPSCC